MGPAMARSSSFLGGSSGLDDPPRPTFDESSFLDDRRENRHEVSGHRRGGLHRQPPVRAVAGRGASCPRSRRPEHGAVREHRPPRRAARLRAAGRQRDRAGHRRAVRERVRRGLPPGQRRGGEAGCRPAGQDDRDDRRRHRQRPAVLRPLSPAGPAHLDERGLRQEREDPLRRGGRLRDRARPPRDAGLTPAPRRSTNSWRWLTGTSRGCRS